MLVVSGGTIDQIKQDGECKIITLEADMEIGSFNAECGIVTEINKIPSNYGKIEWDGSVLTVS